MKMEFHTFTGLNVPITSEVFCIGWGPPGGGGGTAIGPAIVVFALQPRFQSQIGRLLVGKAMEAMLSFFISNEKSAAAKSKD